MGLSFSIRKQLLASTILVAAGSIYGGLNQEALAGGCFQFGSNPAPVIGICGGPANAATDVTQSFNSVGGIGIITGLLFGLDTTTTGGDGIVTNGGNTLIGMLGTINADQVGINSSVTTAGAITGILNTGSITSDNNRGIRLITDADTSNVEIVNGSGALIQAQNDGIIATVQGAGATTTVINSGSITSDNNRGIRLITDADTSNVEITNNLGAIIQAQDNGIIATVQGASATTTITNSGSITSDNNRGIRLITDADTSNVEITNNLGAIIQAQRQGIRAGVEGAGATTTITNSGSITSNGFQGIRLMTDADTSTVNVSHLATGNITSSNDGIHARVRSTNQSVTIQALGEITSTSGDGIQFHGARAAQTNTVNIDVDHTVTATAAAGVRISETFADSANTITINADSNADITANNGIEIDAGNGTEVAINIKSGARVIGSASGIVDGSTAGLGAKTTVLLEGRINGDVYLGGNDDSFTMKDADARLRPGTSAIVDGGAGIDDFTFDNIQRLFRHNLDNFEMVELKNNSFITTRNKTFDTDEYLINSGNTHRGLGLTVIEGNVTNNGTISLADNSVNELYVMTGNLSGNGLYILDARLDATENADLVGVNGNIDPTSRNILRVNDLAGTGAATGNNDTDGILLVGVNGTSVADNFALENGPISAGAFVYDLHHSLGNNFYLQSKFSGSATVIPSAIQGSTLGADALLLGYLIRKGSRLSAPINLEPSDDDRDNDGDSSSFGADILHASEVDPANTYWLRLLGAHGDYDGTVHAGGGSESINTDANFGGVQLGVDFAMPYYPHTSASLWGHYLHQENDVYNKTQAAVAGNSTINSYGVGLGITYDPGTGLYFDALGSISFSTADLKDTTGISGETRGNEFFASAEMGYRMNSGFSNLAFIPQVQVKTHYAEFASYTDSSGLVVTNLDSHRSTVRLGISLEDSYQMSNGNLRLVGGVSWSDVFSSETRADLATTQIDLSDADEFIEGNLGFEYSMDDGSSVWASVNHKSGLGGLDSENTGFDLGFSVKF